jgi:hypothetical protein
MVLRSVILSLKLMLEIVEEFSEASYGRGLVGTVALCLPVGHSKEE